MDYKAIFEVVKNFFTLLCKFLSEVLGEDLTKYEEAIEDVTLPE